MKAALLFVSLVIALFAGLCAPAHAANPRHGTITDLQPIENRGDDESEQVKSRRKIGEKLGSLGGLFAGMGLATKGNSTASAVAGSAVAENGDRIGGEIAAKVGDAGPTTRYMVRVKLDAGKTLILTQLHEQVRGLKVGSRVRVEGKGDDALVYAE